ncbi:hypothetical protein IKQ19_14440, partial [Candidatus Saccharibacteria bacterium]|nr:hypothetical protein [Candidatus Saccharibacteria bacterium]
MLEGVKDKHSSIKRRAVALRYMGLLSQGLPSHKIGVIDSMRQGVARVISTFETGVFPGSFSRR